MSPRRVLHVIPAIAARYGGPSQVCLDTCRALRAAGLEASILTTDADGPGRLPVGPDQRIDIAGVPAVVLPRRWSEAFKWSPDLARWLDAHARDYDVLDVHAVFSHASIAAGAAARRHGVPYVVRPHGALDPWSLSRKRIRKAVLGRLGVDTLLRRAAAVQYTTEDERRLAESSWPGLAPGSVVSLGIDEECFTPRRAAHDETCAMLVLSRLHPKKNLEALIDAFHDVAADAAVTECQLWIAGDGEPAYVAALRARAAAGPAASRVSFLGWLTGDEKLVRLDRARVFASPSHQENFGLSAVEAMARGLPALVSPGVNLARDIEAAGAGWVVEPTRAALRQAIVAVAMDAAELDRRGTRARLFASRFRWETAIGPLVALYDAVARRTGAACLA